MIAGDVQTILPDAVVSLRRYWRRCLRRYGSTAGILAVVLPLCSHVDKIARSMTWASRFVRRER